MSKRIHVTALYITITLLIICICGCGSAQSESVAETTVPATDDISSETSPDKDNYAAGDVPQIYISTKDNVGSSLEKSDGYVDADVVIVDTDSTMLESTDSKIKVRGNSTAEGAKKPYNIKFSEKQEILGLGCAKTWCLLANCFDPTLMRNFLVLDLASRMELQYTPDQRIVEVYLDGTFLGCYNITEKVEAGSDRVAIDTESGDFLIEYEAGKDEEGVTYITTDHNLRFAVNEPEEPTKAQLSAITDVLDALDSALMTYDYSEVLDIIDEESFAKYYVLNEFVKSVDVDYSSVFFYYKDGVLYAGPVWDYDQSMGNAWEEQYPDYYNSEDGLNSYEGKRASWNLVYNYLLEFDEFKDAVKQQYSENHGLFESLALEGGFIDTFVTEYASVIERNFDEAGWLVNGQYSYLMRIPDETYEENVDFLKDWINGRLKWMDEYLEYNNSDIAYNEKQKS